MSDSIYSPPVMDGDEQPTGIEPVPAQEETGASSQFDLEAAELRRGKSRVELAREDVRSSVSALTRTFTDTKKNDPRDCCKRGDKGCCRHLCNICCFPCAYWPRISTACCRNMTTCR